MGVREKREARREAREAAVERLIAEQLERAGDCPTCQHAATEGHWGDSRITHCKTCHVTWNRESNISHCSSCHRTFSTPSNFDKHRSEGECLDPATKGLETKVDSHGTEIWKRPGPDKKVSAWSGSEAQ